MPPVLWQPDNYVPSSALNGGADYRRLHTITASVPSHISQKESPSQAPTEVLDFQRFNGNRINV